MPVAAANLPARRRDLIFRPHGEHGEHVVKDPRTGGYFKLPAQESFLFTLLDGGHTPDQCRAAFERRFGEPLPADDLEQFLSLAREFGFLTAPDQHPSRAPAPAPAAEPAPAPAAAAPSPAPEGRAAKPRQSLLAWRKSVFDPDRLFAALEPALRFIWTRGFVLASVAFIVAAFLISWANRAEIVGDFSWALVMRWETLLLAWLTLVLATTLHEFAHGLTCKHFGGEVHEVGFLLLFFIPCFYCNVSDAWLIGEKSKRLWVTLAGAWCDLCGWALAVLVWRVTPPETLPHYVAWVFMGVTGVRVFFNFNPLLKLDGYYLLSDAIEMHNLRGRAWERLAAAVRWLRWGAPRPAGDPG